ncbi:hypothetical protein HYU13_00990 [Candidatus Woesearchaeota archaeon]|nr:hypothetical protein [Candidatus Woesearchaeota archaeon]
MKRIDELDNPDIVKIDCVCFQVIRNTGLLLNTKRHEMEMAVEMVRCGENALTPSHRLTYFENNPKEITFLVFDKNNNVWRK